MQRIWLLLLTLAIAACSSAPPGGEIDDDDAPDDDDASSDDDDASSDDDDEPLPEVAALTGHPQTPLRRLTPEEYYASLRDIFSDLNFSTSYELEGNLAVGGFENNEEINTATTLRTEQERLVAWIIASIVQPQLSGNLGCEDAGFETENECLRGWFADTGWKFFRRPMTEVEVDFFLDFFFGLREEMNFAPALELMLQALMQSPEFLYRIDFGREDVAPFDQGLEPIDGDEAPRLVELTQWEIATRLSYLILRSVPDDELFAAAAAGQLATPDQIEAQARRLLGTSRARETVVDFHRQWLELDAIERLVKDPEAHAGWGAELKDSLQNETKMFVEWVIFDGAGTFDAMLTEPRSIIDSWLAEYYGVPVPSEDWTLVEMPAGQRAGVLTHGGFLANKAHPIYASPVKRGVFVLDRVLCDRPGPPPDNVNFFPPTEETFPDPETNRERYVQHLVDPSCAVCHERIDGVGFGFENYDGAGRWRDTDGGLPVDATGGLVGTDVDGDFDGPVELMDALADSDQAERCYAIQWFRYGFGPVEREGDTAQIDAIAAEFAAAGGRVDELLVRMVRSERFRHRTEIVMGL